jgi:hypothetical protein
VLPGAPPALKGKLKMRTLFAGIALATAAALLGGCAGGGLGGSPLPLTGSSQLHRLDTIGGGPEVSRTKLHASEVLNGPGSGKHAKGSPNEILNGPGDGKNR